MLLAPEQLANDEVVHRLAAAGPSLLVVDEAHCVSQWGHDFRPEYLRLAVASRALGRPPILALTATAAPPVRADIVTELEMRDAELVVRGFDRPEIRLVVERHHDAERKTRALLDWVVARVGGRESSASSTRRRSTRRRSSRWRSPSAACAPARTTAGCRPGCARRLRRPSWTTARST